MGRAGIPVVGGGLGLIVVIAYALLGGNPSDLGPILQPGGATGPESPALATDRRRARTKTARCGILALVRGV